jgi:ABC-2 type transport system ATP-binding protein
LLDAKWVHPNRSARAHLRWLARSHSLPPGRVDEVLVSSHLLLEMALTATELVVIGRGRLITQSSTASFVDSAPGTSVRVSSPQLTALRDVLDRNGINATPTGDGALVVTGADTVRVGAAASAGVAHAVARRRTA